MITNNRFNRGSGGVYVLSAPEAERDELELAVLEQLKRIDPWASPRVESRDCKDGVLTVKVKYYGMD